MKQLNKLKLKLVIFLSALCLTGFQSCNSTPKKIIIPLGDYKPTVSEKEYYRDSLYLVHTVKAFEAIGFSNFDQKNVSTIWIDSILYSPDKLKLFALCITKYPANDFVKKYKFPDAKFTYDGTGLVAYRTNLYEPWIVYEFTRYHPVEWLAYTEVQNLLRNFYFFEFKNDGDAVWDPRKNDWGSEYYKYNINQKDFWERSVVWRKGAKIPGFYNFQLLGNYKPGDTDYEVELPVIVYPDSILQMFK